MQNTGLSNRFPQWVKWQWQGWHSCMVCSRNQWDALHHIMSPSTSLYIKGPHNHSILNSSPIHNEKCHLYNPWLHKPDNIATLLFKTYDALLQFQDYRLKRIDQEFLRLYRPLYRGKLD